METENTLFTDAEFKSFLEAGMTIEEKSIVKYYATVTIDGKTFDAIDLKETLDVIIKPYDEYITNEVMIRVLKKIGVLEYEGSNRSMMSCRAGPNAEAFRKLLVTKMKSLPHFDDLEKH